MSRLLHFSFLLSPLLAASLCSTAEARWGRWSWGSDGCDAACAAPCDMKCQTTYKTIERTVMVPEMATETRTVNVTECRAEERQRTYTVCRPVMERQTVEYQYVVPTYETRTREVTCTVCRPVMTTQERQVTVMVPEQQTRQGTRHVCRMVEVKQKHTVCEDHGSWQQVTQNYTVGCGDCAQTCTRTCNVWVPNMQIREVETTCMRPQMQEEQYQYTITVCNPQTRTETVQVCNLVREQQTSQVQYTVCVPQMRTGTREVAVCRLVSEPKTETCMVQVPYTVQKQVQVQVCHMVPKTITCQVPVTTCAPCNTDCGGAPCDGAAPAAPKAPAAPPAATPDAKT
jgi:hypothetical protein